MGSPLGSLLAHIFCCAIEESIERVVMCLKCRQSVQEVRL